MPSQSAPRNKILGALCDVRKRFVLYFVRF